VIGASVQWIKSLDVIGCGIFIPAIFMLLLAMTQGSTEMDWDLATIMGLFAGSSMMFILSVCWERYQGDGANRLPCIATSEPNLTLVSDQ